MEIKKIIRKIQESGIRGKGNEIMLRDKKKTIWIRLR